MQELRLLRALLPYGRAAFCHIQGPHRAGGVRLLRGVRQGVSFRRDLYEGRKLMDILDYETALAVYRYESWSEAAYATFQSPSSVSKRINKLEKELGVKLFDRAGRASGSVLTDAGRVAMPYIKQIVSDFHSLALTAEDLRREMRDRLTVGYQLLAGSVGAEEILARFRSENPDIDIAHVMRGRQDLFEMVCSGETDCAFVFSFDEDTDKAFLDGLREKGALALTYMRCETLWIGLPREHPLASRESVSLAELSGETFIVNSVTGGPPLRKLFGINGQEKMLGSLKARALDYVGRQVMTDYIVSGKGVLPTICIPPIEAVDRVAFVRVREAAPKASASFIYPRRNASRAVKTLLRFVREYAEGRRQLEHK